MTVVDVRRIPVRRPGCPLPTDPESQPARVPLAAPPWIDTPDEQAARLARLAREIAAYEDTVVRRNRAARWEQAIRAAQTELAADARAAA